MFITLTVYDEFGEYTYPAAFNINKIELFHPVDMEDPEEKPKWNTVLVVNEVMFRVMEDYGFVLGAINEITSTRSK